MGCCPQLTAAAASPGRERAAAMRWTLNIEQLSCPSKGPDLTQEVKPRGKHHIAGLLPLHLGRQAAAAAAVGGAAGRRRLQSSSSSAASAAADEPWRPELLLLLLLVVEWHRPLLVASTTSSSSSSSCCCLSTSVQPKAHPQAVPSLDSPSTRRPITAMA